MRTILTTLHSKFIHNSLALPCLAAYCGDECGEILIREFTTHEPRDSILAILLNEKPDVVAFSVYLWNRRESLDLVDALQIARPELKIILGGPEVSFDGPDLFDRHPGVSALVRGEGEEPFRRLLSAWQEGHQPASVPRTIVRHRERLVVGPESPPLKELDDIPSPYKLAMTDLKRGFVYYETSRGCPFNCSFCLSARDNHIRSYSMERIQSDLRILMENEVAKVKLVDRTFNYDGGRARKIFSFILENNKSTHFHFEIGAHLLDNKTLDLLANVPADMFQFEIGVQSTLEDTLQAIDRKVNLNKLEANVQRLVADNRIHLHLDLVAGLPNDTFDSFLDSINRVIALQPHHLQIEPVKLLPGSPLRDQATELKIRFDPNPPYTILDSPNFPYEDLQKIQDISRLIDLTYNSACFDTFLQEFSELKGSFADGLAWMAHEWRRRDLFRFPMNRQTIFHNLINIICDEVDESSVQKVVDSLALDYARCERVIISRIPDFFETTMTSAEQQWVRNLVREKTEEIRGKGIKLQYFASRFKTRGDNVRLFLYLTKTGDKMRVEEYRRDQHSD